MVRFEFFFLLLLLLLISHLATAIADGSPSHGCFWTESCQSKWFGGCGPGLVIADQSENCNGLCQASSYQSWFPFYTHYYCCKPAENPRVMNKCMRCKNKLDLGDEYICCSDCSDPYLIDKNCRFGYCKTGAKLAVQQKPQVLQIFAGPWMKCSSPCGGDIRYRDVNCYESTNDFSTKQYPVDDSSCSDQEMPVRQESCNQQSCGDSSILDSSDNKPSGTSGWLVALLILLGLVAVGDLGFAG